VILLAVALTLALSPAAAAGPSRAQPDLVIVGRDGNTFTGNDIYNADGVGQERSVIIQRHLVLIVRLQNDSTTTGIFDVSGSPAAPGFKVRYFSGQTDVTRDATSSSFLRSAHAGQFFKVRIVINVLPEAPLGAKQSLVVSAVEHFGDATDAVKLDVTKVSTPD
jgi:hypothetical protein